MPTTRASCGRSRAITACDDALFGPLVRTEMFMRPELTELPVPMKEATASTAGSARMISVTRCCKASVASKDESSEALVQPASNPVSSCANQPFGVVR